MPKSKENKCIVCGQSLSSGYTAWHMQCDFCSYEKSSLEPAIGKSKLPCRLDEQQRLNSLKSLRQRNFRKICDTMLHHGIVPGSRVLEVGSAHGWFLETAIKFYDILGIEADPEIFTNDTIPQSSLLHGYFPQILGRDEQFDAIVFNDTLEHLPDLENAIAACAMHLKDNGFIVANLPSSQGFFYSVSKLLAFIGISRYFERMWQYGLPSPHLHYFNANNLPKLMERFGFVPVATGQMDRLSTLSVSGLLDRIRYTGHTSRLAAYALCVPILFSVPALRLLPNDIMLHLFVKK